MIVKLNAYECSRNKFGTGYYKWSFINTTGCPIGTSGGTGDNTILHGSSSCIVGNASHNVIASGRFNTIFKTGASNLFGNAISGGGYHAISTSYAAIGGGMCHEISCQFSSIMGGYLNAVSSAYAFIGGGKNNIVSGDYSAVLGGSGNTDSGYSYVGIFGQNITAACPGFFYTNNQAITNMPSNLALVPVGGLYYDITDCSVKINC